MLATHNSCMFAGPVLAGRRRSQTANPCSRGVYFDTRAVRGYAARPGCSRSPTVRSFVLAVSTSGLSRSRLILTTKRADHGPEGHRRGAVWLLLQAALHVIRLQVRHHALTYVCHDGIFTDAIQLLQQTRYSSLSRHALRCARCCLLVTSRVLEHACSATSLRGH